MAKKAHKPVNVKLFSLFLGTLTISLVCTVFMFSLLISKYQKTTALESAGHLVEISNQIAVNIEQAVQSDKNLARSVAANITATTTTDEAELFRFLREQRMIWNVSSISLFNDEGYCVNQDGIPRNHDDTAETAYRIVKYGEQFTILKSVVEYGIRVKTRGTIRNTPIVAVSVGRDLNTIIANCDIKSFGGSGAVYLTRQNGVKISQTDSARSVFNITALFKDSELAPVSHAKDTLADVMANSSQAVFIATANGHHEYTVVTPVKTGQETWLLFLIVPLSVVNRTMYSYSSFIMLFMILSAVFIGMTVFIFFAAYSRNSVRYTKELSIREDDLRRALAIADSANRAKTQFLSNMSHDIRTPMNAIINMTQFTIENYDNKEKAFGYLKVIKDSSNHLLALINDVLDMSRIESGKMSFLTEPFDLHETLDVVCAVIQPLCSAKHQKFAYTPVNISHTSFIGDAVCLNRILINLLNNSVKFTPEGGAVSFTVTELDSIDATTVPFRFEIQDTGIGISEENIKKIFEPFSRADDDVRVRETEGSGLGLSIAKRLIEGLGGHITVTSKKNEGSLFAIELFFTIGKTSASRTDYSAEQMSTFTGKRALLVEDNEINREIAQMIMQKWNLVSDAVDSGEKAVELFSRSAADYYDIIYMDIQMNGMNGYEAAQAIRRSAHPGAQTIPIVAMTANAFSEDIEKARAAGMNAHVSKPIDPARLHHITALLFSQNRGRYVE